MNNKEILKSRWNEIDDELKKYLKKFKFNVKNRVQVILNTYKITSKNLYSYLNNKDLSIFKDELEEALELEINDYLRYKIQRMMNRTKIKYNELLEILIEIAYEKNDLSNKKIEDELFNNVVKITAINVQNECFEVQKKKKKKLFDIPIYFIPALLATPLYLGYEWLNYKQSKNMYDANKTYRKILIDLNKQEEFDLNNYDKEFQTQRNQFIRYKNNDFYGAMANQVASMCSETALWGMRKQGVEKVRFVAVLDEKTTHICESMDGQIFKLNDWNTYYRYSEDDKKMVKYVTKGLVIGENEPSLHVNCRSILIPYK